MVRRNSGPYNNYTCKIGVLTSNLQDKYTLSGQVAHAASKGGYSRASGRRGWMKRGAGGGVIQGDLNTSMNLELYLWKAPAKENSSGCNRDAIKICNAWVWERSGHDHNTEKSPQLAYSYLAEKEWLERYKGVEVGIGWKGQPALR